MNDRFIESCYIPLKYDRKPETKGSFYLTEGSKLILPERISWGIFAQKKTSSKDFQKKNEINAIYKKDEKGIYYELDSKKVHSSIWENEKYPEFYGYGIIDERYPTRDLLIIYSENQCFESMEIHIFRNMGRPESMEFAFCYLHNLKKKPH